MSILDGLKPPFDESSENRCGEMVWFIVDDSGREVNPLRIVLCLDAIPALEARVKELEAENATMRNILNILRRQTTPNWAYDPQQKYALTLDGQQMLDLQHFDNALMKEPTDDKS